MLISRGGPLATVQMSLDDPATWRAIPDDQLRIVLARRDGRWVSAARAGEDVTIDDVAGGGMEWLAAVVAGQLDVVHSGHTVAHTGAQRRCRRTDGHRR